MVQMQGTAGKRPANMWGAVPQHHQAVPPAQAQAQHYALAQAAAQAQALRHAEAPPPPPNPQMGPFNHPGYAELPTSAACVTVSCLASHICLLPGSLQFVYLQVALKGRFCAK